MQWMADDMADIADGGAGDCNPENFRRKKAADSCAPVASLEAEAEEIPMAMRSDEIGAAHIRAE